MGGLDVMRNLCLCLWAECFHYELEPGKEFCMILVDLMQALAPSVMQQKLGIDKHGFEKKFFDIDFVTRKIDTTVAQYINFENDKRRPIVSNTIVFMLDTVHQVPRNKGAKQKSRDRGGGEDEEVPIHMNEKLYNEMVFTEGREQMGSNLFFIDNDHAPRYAMNGKTIWRSVNLKLQLYRLITRHVLHAKLKPGMSMLLDDGLAYTTDEWDRLREGWIESNDLRRRSPFEQEFMTHQFTTDSPNFFTRFLVLDNGQIYHGDSTEVGEADIKIQSYIRRDLGLKKFLVVNQDTDVIFILLLHMQTLLKGDESDDEYEVWIDTRTPNYNIPVKPYRYINIKQLYYRIINFFKEEFPTVLHPIETFCFLVFSKETDFTRDFPSCFQIKNEFIWNIFSELHCTKKSFVVFQEGKAIVSRSEKRQCTHLLSGLLDSAIQYDWKKNRFILKHEKISQFYYLLLQLKLMDIRKAIGLKNGNYDLESRKSLMLPAELLLFGRDVSERMAFFQRFEEEKSKEDFFTVTRKRKAGEELKPEEGEKKFKLSSSFGKRKPQQRRLTISITTDEHDEIVCSDDEAEEKTENKREMGMVVEKEKPIPYHMRSYLTSNRKELLKLVKKYTPNEYFGLFTENDMLARIYRIEWFFAYCRDGWKGVLPCCEKSRHDPSLSLWGWEERFVEGEEEARKAMNSSYYKAHYDPYSPLLFRFSEVVETSRVHHRRS